jgi:hypothetical protein
MKVSQEDVKLAFALVCLAVVVLTAAAAMGAGEEILFQQDFESGETVGQHPTGDWFFNEGTGASALVSDQATDVSGAPQGSYNLKFHKSQTGTGTGLTVQCRFERNAVDSGKLVVTYWTYFESGQLMRHVLRGYNPYKHYVKMIVRGDWPGDVRLEYPFNGQQLSVAGDSWHKLSFVVEFDPNDIALTLCRFFVDDEEHPGSPAPLLETLQSPIGSVEFNTANPSTAACYFDDFTIQKVPPKPRIASMVREDGRLALEWSGADLLGEIPTLYRAFDAGGPWSLLQGNIEIPCLVDLSRSPKAFYRVGSVEEPSAERTVIFSDDFEAYSDSAEIETLGGWTVVNGSGYADVRWRLWNTAGDLLNTEDPDLFGLSDNYVIANSDFDQSAQLDEELISPEIDCGAYSKVWVEFSSHVKV